MAAAAAFRLCPKDYPASPQQATAMSAPDDDTPSPLPAFTTRVWPPRRPSLRGAPSRPGPAQPAAAPAPGASAHPALAVAARPDPATGVAACPRPSAAAHGSATERGAALPIRRLDTAPVLTGTSLPAAQPMPRARMLSPCPARRAAVPCSTIIPVLDGIPGQPARAAAASPSTDRHAVSWPSCQYHLRRLAGQRANAAIWRLASHAVTLARRCRRAVS